MDMLVRDLPVRVYTGGRPFDSQRPAVLLIHGAGHDHSVWNLPARHLAHHGFTVLAPDLPGHGRSAGPVLDSVEALADWVLELVATLRLPQVSLVGHSMGSLIALETTARAQPGVVTHLGLVGSVAPMPVAQALLDAAAQARDRAHRMINQWSYAPANQLGASPLPGQCLTRLNLRLMERQAEGVLATDLAACNAYQNGLAAAARVRCPTLLVCGERDQMTPPKAARPLREALIEVPGGARLATLAGAGHAMMSEAPAALAEALSGFLHTA